MENESKDNQIIEHISELKEWNILEICDWKEGVKKIFAKKANELGIFFINDENLIAK